VDDDAAPEWTDDLITRLGAVREALRTRTEMPGHAEATVELGVDVLRYVRDFLSEVMNEDVPQYLQDTAIRLFRLIEAD
jgi:hypothetical protein